MKSFREVLKNNRNNHLISNFTVPHILLALYTNFGGQWSTLASFLRANVVIGPAWSNLGVNHLIGMIDGSDFETGRPCISKGGFSKFDLGSCGVSLGVGVGLQQARLDNGEVEHNTFVLVGDGETNEGVFWEALNLATLNKDLNVKCFIDLNGIQCSGETSTFCGYELKSLHKLFPVRVAVISRRNLLNDQFKLSKGFEIFLIDGGVDQISDCREANIHYGNLDS